jgi:hypothetical protein
MAALELLFVSLLQALPAVLALLAIARVNVRREVRAAQIFMPLIAVVYAVVVLYVFTRFTTQLDDAVNQLAGQFVELWSRLPFVTDTQQVLPTRYLDPRVALFLAGTVALVVFAGLKGALIPLFLRLFQGDKRWGQRLTERIYEYDETTGIWFVESRLTQMRNLYRALYWASVVLTLILMTLLIAYPTWPGFMAVAFPALAAMVIGEFFFAFDGMTREEFHDDVAGERDSALRVAVLGPLRSILDQVFPGRILSDGVHISSRAAVESSQHLNELARVDSNEARLAATYFKRLKELGAEVDTNLAQASAGVMQGSSILIMNPFYSDLTPYLCLPAYYELLQGRKCLIIAGRDALAEDLAIWMRDGLTAITGIPNLWRVEVLDDIEKEMPDVGVLRFADVHSKQLSLNQDAFFARVGLILLAEPSRMLPAGQLGLPLVIARCSQGHEPTFVAFDGNHDGLVDALSHLLKSSLTEVVASALPTGASCEVIWRAEGPNMHTKILPNVGRFLGGGTEISAVALKYQLREAHWVGGDAFPVVDMRWIAQQYYTQLASFAGLDLSQESVANSLSAHSNPWGLTKRDTAFLIVEDERKNVYEAARRHATRAIEAGFVNVISEPYLFRDYMVANRDLFAFDPKAIPSIIPDFCRTERNAALRIVLALATFGMSEGDLRREFDVAGWSVPPDTADVGWDSNEWEAGVIKEVRRAITQHLGVDGGEVIINSVAGFAAYSDLASERRYRIEAGSELDRVLEGLRPAYFLVEDEVEDTNFIGGLLFGQAHQMLLPGQFVTYSGKYYQVQRIDPAGADGGVVLRRAGEHITDRRSYRQLRTYALRDPVPSSAVDAHINFGGIEVIRLLAEIDVQTHGYIESTSRSELGVGREVLLGATPVRSYRRKAVLQVRLPNVPPAVRRTIAVLLNESFVTLYPTAYQYVVALTDDPNAEMGNLLNRLVAHDCEDSIFIVEDSTFDMGLTVSVERNWDRLMEMVTDYLHWLTTPAPASPLLPDTIASAALDLSAVPPLEPPKKRSWWRRALGRVGRWFRRDRRKKDERPAGGALPDGQPTDAVGGDVGSNVADPANGAPIGGAEGAIAPELPEEHVVADAPGSEDARVTGSSPDADVEHAAVSEPDVDGASEGESGGSGEGSHERAE